MRTLLLILLLAFIGSSDIIANPIVIDSERRPTEMVFEDVKVSVGSSSSDVSGVYRFRQVNGQQFHGQKTHITIFIPVFLPNVVGGTEKYEAQHGSPKVKIGTQCLTATRWNDITLDGSPNEVKLPAGWCMAIYVCNVPLRFVGKEFEASVAYTQPHMPNSIVAYVPIRPPRSPSLCRITFVAQAGQRLRYASSLAFLRPSKSTIQVIPKDRKLIRVISIPGREQTSRADSPTLALQVAAHS